MPAKERPTQLQLAQQSGGSSRTSTINQQVPTPTLAPFRSGSGSGADKHTSKEVQECHRLTTELAALHESAQSYSKVSVHARRRGEAQQQQRQQRQQQQQQQQRDACQHRSALTPVPTSTQPHMHMHPPRSPAPPRRTPRYLCLTWMPCCKRWA